MVGAFLRKLQEISSANRFDKCSGGKIFNAVFVFEAFHYVSRKLKGAQA